MAFPFTPHTTFTDDATPSIGADFLMAMQNEGVNPAAAVAWKTRPLVTATSTDNSSITLAAVTVFCLDATTSKFGYASITGQSLTSSNLEGGGSFSSSTWYYTYAKLDNNVPSIVISTTGPDGERLTKSGDQTLRFLFSFYVNGAGNIARFSRDGRVTHWLDRVYIHGSDAGMVSWSTSGLTHSLAAAAPPHVTSVDLWIYLNSGATVYTFFLSHYGDSGAQVRFAMSANKELSWAQRIATMGQAFIQSSVSNMTSAYGFLRVVDFEE